MLDVLAFMCLSSHVKLTFECWSLCVHNCMQNSHLLCYSFSQCFVGVGQIVDISKREFPPSYKAEVSYWRVFRYKIGKFYSNLNFIRNTYNFIALGFSPASPQVIPLICNKNNEVNNSLFVYL